MKETEHVYRDDQAVGWLELTCPKCGSLLLYTGGNIAAFHKPVPGHDDLKWVCGGPIHGYECTWRCWSGNYTDIPDECWSVHFFSDEELAQYLEGQRRLRKYLDDHTDERGVLSLHGPRQRPI